MSVVPGAWQTEVGESRLGISVQGYIEYEIGFECLHTCLIVYRSLGDVFPSALPWATWIREHAIPAGLQIFR